MYDSNIFISLLIGVYHYLRKLYLFSVECWLWKYYIIITMSQISLKYSLNLKYYGFIWQLNYIEEMWDSLQTNIIFWLKNSKTVKELLIEMIIEFWKTFGQNLGTFIENKQNQKCKIWIIVIHIYMQSVYSYYILILFYCRLHCYYASAEDAHVYLMHIKIL